MSQESSFTVTFTTYSGMTMTLGRKVDRDTTARIIKRRFAIARNLDQPVSKIGNGQWEFETPEDANAISDMEGFLTVRKA